jgi:hypothetical protein
MKKMRNVLKIATVIPFIILLFSCNNRVGNSEKSHTLLVISKLTGTTATGDEADFAQSDVVKVDTTTLTNYVVADSATATLTAKLIEPEPPAAGPSFKQNVILTRYTVSFTLSDGSGVPGVDVPLPFEGSLSSIIEVDSSTDVGFVIVTEAAKLASPLFDLRAGGVIQARATVTLFGHDLADNPVQATGDISIFFANYIDK